MFERLCYDVSRGAVPLQLHYDHVPLAVHAKQVDGFAEVGRDLPPDDQKRTIFENPVRVGFQPLLKDGFLVTGLERHPPVLREPALRSNAEYSHLSASINTENGPRAGSKEDPGSRALLGAGTARDQELARPRATHARGGSPRLRSARGPRYLPVVTRAQHTATEATA